MRKILFYFFFSVLVQLYTPWGTTRPYLLSISALIYSIFFIPITILLPHHLLFLANLLSFLRPQLLFSILCSLLQLFFYFFFTSSQPFFYIFFTSSTSILLSWCFSSTSSALLLKLFFFHFICSFTSTILLSLTYALLLQPPTYFCFIQSSSSATLLLLEKFALLLYSYPSFTSFGLPL